MMFYSVDSLSHDRGCLPGSIRRLGTLTVPEVVPMFIVFPAFYPGVSGDSASVCSEGGQS